MLFENAVTSIDDIFHSCFYYCDEDIYLNRYEETCTESYFDTSQYVLPTSLLAAIEIDTSLGNNDWRNAYGAEVQYLLTKGHFLPSNSKPSFQIKSNGIHKVTEIVLNSLLLSSFQKDKRSLSKFQ
jgi:hypothetical protein